MGLLALAAVLGEGREAVRSGEGRTKRGDRPLAGAAERWERYRAKIGAAAAALQLQQSDTARRALEAAPREHRGWGWGHLRSQLDDSPPCCPAKPPEDFLWPRPVISPTGDRIATIDCEGAAIRLWDATTGAAVGLLRGHEGPVLVLCYSPDGKPSPPARAPDHPAPGPGRRETCGGPERAREAGRVAGVRSGRSLLRSQPGAARTPAVGDDRADRERSRSPGVSPPGAVQRPLSVNWRGGGRPKGSPRLPGVGPIRGARRGRRPGRDPPGPPGTSVSAAAPGRPREGSRPLPSPRRDAPSPGLSSRS